MRQNQRQNRKILVVDGDKAALESTAKLLTRRGFEVVKTHCAAQSLRLAYQHQPDLALLDAFMPKMSGWDICRRLREMSNMPIIFLSARSSVQDIVKGLELGADDYIAKPCHDDELAARIQACLRRSPDSDTREELVFNRGRFRINLMNREVWVNDSPRHLTPKEFSLLAALVRQAGRVVQRTDLAADAWGEEYRDAIASLKLYIHYLRRKLEDNPQQPRYILTARGAGYRFVKP